MTARITRRQLEPGATVAALDEPRTLRRPSPRRLRRGARRCSYVRADRAAPSELRALRWSHVSLVEGTLRVRRVEVGGGRTIDCAPPTLVNELSAHYQETTAGLAHLWPAFGRAWPTTPDDGQRRTGEDRSARRLPTHGAGRRLSPASNGGWSNESLDSVVPRRRDGARDGRRGGIRGYRGAQRRHLPDQLRDRVGNRLPRPRARLHGARLGAPRHHVPAADVVPGQARPRVVPPRARSRDGLPEGLARRADVHVHGAKPPPVQRRQAGSGNRVRARDQPRALAADGLPVGRPAERRRRRGGRSRWSCGYRVRRHRARQHPHDPLRPAARRSRGPGRDAVHVRRSGVASDRSRGRRGDPGRRAVPRHRVPAGRADQDPPEPLLRREPTAPRRRVRRRSSRRIATRHGPGGRPQRGGLGASGRCVVLLRDRPATVVEVRHQQGALLLTARIHRATARVQRRATAVPGQPRAAPCRESRDRQERAQRGSDSHADRPVPPPCHAGLRRRGHLPPRRPRPRQGKGTGARKHARRQGSDVHDGLPAARRDRHGRP